MHLISLHWLYSTHSTIGTIVDTIVLIYKTTPLTQLLQGTTSEPLLQTIRHQREASKHNIPLTVFSCLSFCMPTRLWHNKYLMRRTAGFQKMSLLALWVMRRLMIMTSKPEVNQPEWRASRVNEMLWKSQQVYWKAEQISLDGTLENGQWCGQQEGATQGQHCCFAIKDSETAANTHQGRERVGSLLSAYS